MTAYKHFREVNTMYANYHTHTTRCSHATGADEDYIKAAIESGFKILGFSDHAPCLFPDGSQSWYHVQISDLEDYMTSIRALREQYGEQIQIHLGFEMEYYPLCFRDSFARLKAAGAEYLILGQHAIENEVPGGRFSTRGYSAPADLKTYVREVCEGLQTGVYSYLAHPEVFKFLGEKEQYLELMRPICVTARETGTPLEINLLGIRDHRDYPIEEFWAMAAEEHCQVVLGSDAHSPDCVYDGYSIPIAMEWVKKYDLRLLQEVELRKL